MVSACCCQLAGFWRFWRTITILLGVTGPAITNRLGAGFLSGSRLKNQKFGNWAGQARKFTTGQLIEGTNGNAPNYRLCLEETDKCLDDLSAFPLRRWGRLLLEGRVWDAEFCSGCWVCQFLSFSCCGCSSAAEVQSSLVCQNSSGGTGLFPSLVA